jgi:UPF0176 protein
MARTLIAALYKFTLLSDLAELRPKLEQCCEDAGVRGTLLLAHEGINGTLAGPESGVRQVLAYLRSDPRLSDLEHKESWADEIPFHRLKVRLKNEIVTMGLPEIDPTSLAATYVKAADWNALLDDPEVLVLDTRNDYEVEIGTFEGAISPNTESFTQFSEWFEQSDVLAGKSKVAMFCTGGIRCEKAGSYLLSRGVDEVFHLKGGILKYLEEVPVEQSRWQGECFVFDGRVALNHHLEPGSYTLCFGCRRAVSAEAKLSPEYVEGVCCPYCHSRLSADQRERFAERHKQIQLAAGRSEPHLGQKLERPERAPDVPLGDRTLPVLYSFRRCPYAMRARMALLVGEQLLELREVELRRKPEPMLALSPKGTVPILWLQDGTVLEESLDIMVWALERHDPHHWLPEDGPLRQEMLTLIGQNDGNFKHHLDRYKYPDRYDGAVALEHRACAEEFLAQLNHRLAGQDYLYGDTCTFADAAIAPFVRQFANTDRTWFDQAPYPNLQRWLDTLLNSEFFTGMMKKIRPWKPSTLGVLFPGG